MNTNTPRPSAPPPGAVSIFPDQLQLNRIHATFPGRQFRYLAGPEKNGSVDDYYGIIEGDPKNPEDVEKLRRLKEEVGAMYVKLVLGGADWKPPK